ncbi:hypothetical protein LSTR_LSTR008154 [Laodelphax striatellus]|uniref:UBC core domain-containing protein n=1 Tax=Laodelphax striatellus TaxID=195883 RepID=A0A482WZ32_LAOST|nr:hypothetical protein LSTR_LSTR008154 [Laodelphax striatellus]
MSEFQSALLLRKQLTELKKCPVDGFSAGLIDESNVYKWEVMVIGHALQRWILQGTSHLSQGVSFTAAHNEVRLRHVAHEHRQIGQRVHIDSTRTGRRPLGLRARIRALAARTHGRDYSSFSSINAGRSEQCRQCGRGLTASRRLSRLQKQCGRCVRKSHDNFE